MLANLDVEKVLLGLALSDQSCAERLAELPMDTFTAPETRKIWQIIHDLVIAHQQPDLVTLSSKLVLPRDVDVSRVAMDGMAKAISPVMYGQYETNALDLRRRRVMREKCAAVVNRIENPGENSEQLLAELQAAVTDTELKPQSVSMREAVPAFLENLGKKNVMLSTGIAGFDRLTGGFAPGMMVVLGARPGVGKSALALSIAAHVSVKSGPVLMISLEMTDQEIVTRLAAAWSGVDLQKILTGELTDEDWGNVWGPTEAAKKMPIRFSMASTPLQVRREAGSMLRNGGLKLIVIDYLQLMRADNPGKSQYENVSQISREVKLLAMELKVPILALTQFNRNSENGNSKPTMADARDSGSIEQDANVFLVQYAPKEPKQDSEFYEFWDYCQREGYEFQILEVAKNRQGPVGYVPLKFDKPRMKFTTMAKEQ